MSGLPEILEDRLLRLREPLSRVSLVAGSLSGSGEPRIASVVQELFDAVEEIDASLEFLLRRVKTSPRSSLREDCGGLCREALVRIEPALSIHDVHFEVCDHGPVRGDREYWSEVISATLRAALRVFVGRSVVFGLREEERSLVLEFRVDRTLHLSELEGLQRVVEDHDLELELEADGVEQRIRLRSRSASEGTDE